MKMKTKGIGDKAWAAASDGEWRGAAGRGNEKVVMEVEMKTDTESGRRW